MTMTHNLRKEIEQGNKTALQKKKIITYPIKLKRPNIVLIP